MKVRRMTLIKIIKLPIKLLLSLINLIIQLLKILLSLKDLIYHLIDDLIVKVIYTYILVLTVLLSIK